MWKRRFCFGLRGEYSFQTKPVATGHVWICLSSAGGVRAWVGLTRINNRRAASWKVSRPGSYMAMAVRFATPKTKAVCEHRRRIRSDDCALGMRNLTPQSGVTWAPLNCFNSNRAAFRKFVINNYFISHCKATLQSIKREVNRANLKINLLPAATARVTFWLNNIVNGTKVNNMSLVPVDWLQQEK